VGGNVSGPSSNSTGDGFSASQKKKKPKRLILPKNLLGRKDITGGKKTDSATPGGFLQKKQVPKRMNVLEKRGSLKSGAVRSIGQPHLPGVKKTRNTKKKRARVGCRKSDRKISSRKNSRLFGVSDERGVCIRLLWTPIGRSQREPSSRV